MGGGWRRGGLWSRRAGRVGLRPAGLPRTILLLALVIAVVILQLVGGPFWLVAGIGLALAGAVFSRFEKSLALAAAGLSLAGLISLFIVPLGAEDLSGWLIVVSRVSLGLATLTALMVFVEKR